MLFHLRIAPHFFQLIEFPLFRHHDMYNNVDIIYKYPLQVLLTLVVIRRFAAIIFNGYFNGVGNGPDLGLIGCSADDKKIGYSFRNFPEVQRNQVFAFFILDGPDYGLEYF